MIEHTHPKVTLYPIDVEVNEYTYTAFAILSEETGQPISVLVRAILDTFVEQTLTNQH